MHQTQAWYTQIYADKTFMGINLRNRPSVDWDRVWTPDPPASQLQVLRLHSYTSISYCCFWNRVLLCRPSWSGIFWFWIHSNPPALVGRSKLVYLYSDKAKRVDRPLWVQNSTSATQWHPKDFGPGLRCLFCGSWLSHYSVERSVSKQLRISPNNDHRDGLSRLI